MRSTTVAVRFLVFIGMTVGALAPLAARAADAAPPPGAHVGPHAADGSLDKWPWFVRTSGTVTAIGSVKGEDGKRALEAALRPFPRPGDPPPAEVRVRLGETPIWRNGVKVDAKTVAVGDVATWWVCASTAPEAPGDVLELAPTREQR